MVGEITENNMSAQNMSPEEYAQQQALTRQQQMATLLMQQGQQQPQGQMVSGRYVPTSFFQNLVPLANIAASQYVGKKADTEQAKLAQAIRQNKSLAEQKIADLAFGKPAIPGAEGAVGVDAIKPDMIAALREINNNYYGAGADIKPLLYKQLSPEPTPEEKRFKAAVADGSWNVQKQGGLNAFLNQLSEKDKADLRIKNAQLNLQQREFAFNTGTGMPGVGGAVVPQVVPQVAPQGAPQVPLRTINPGSPILAPGQQQNMPQAMPQNAPQAMPQGQMPVFGSKAEQDIYVATQKEKGRLQAEAMNALPAAQLKVQSAIGAINNMIGDTTVDKSGNLVYGKTKPHAGFYESVGMPSITNEFGFTGLYPGSDLQDFKTEFAKVGGQAFLQAVETMRGTGALSEAEGEKATKAITSMSLAQSEKAFVKAANEFRDAVSKGYVATQQKAGVVPFNPSANPVGRKLVYNQDKGIIE